MKFDYKAKNHRHGAIIDGEYEQQLLLSLYVKVW